MTDDDTQRGGPAPVKALTMLLREARSLSRRADKLSRTATDGHDPTTQRLAAQACTSIEELVEHLMTLERRAQQNEKSAGRRR